MSALGRKLEQLSGEPLDSLIAEVVLREEMPGTTVLAGTSVQLSPKGGWQLVQEERLHWRARPFSSDAGLALWVAEHVARLGWSCHLHHAPMCSSDVWACTLVHDNGRRISYLPPLLSEPIPPALAISRAFIRLFLEAPEALGHLSA